MDDHVSLGVVGFGAMAKAHVDAFRHLGTKIVASCNRSEAGRRKAEDAGIPRTFSDPREMVDRCRPDALLLTPSVLSVFGTARDLIPTGLPMLMEKPPGTSAAETRELRNLASRHGTPVMVGLNRRFYSVYHAALARMGGPGKVTAVQVDWSEDPARMLKLGHPEALLPKLVYANSLHGLDLLSFFAGPLRSFTAWGRNLDSKAPPWRWQMSVEGEACDGARVRFFSTWDAPGRWRLQVDACSFRMVSFPLEAAVVAAAGSEPESMTPADEDVQFKPGLVRQAAYFLKVVTQRSTIAWPACTLDDAILGMDLAEELTRVCVG